MEGVRGRTWTPSLAAPLLQEGVGGSGELGRPERWTGQAAAPARAGTRVSTGSSAVHLNDTPELMSPSLRLFAHGNASRPTGTTCSHTSAVGFSTFVTATLNTALHPRPRA